ncbi:response regulator [Arcticibacter tournemirensis]
MRKLSFQQQVLTGFGLALFIVFLLAIVSLVSIQDQRDDIEWVEEAERMISLNANIQQKLTNAETNQRGYVITPLNSFLRSYRQEVNQVMPMISELRRMADDNPQQLKNIDSLNYYAGRKIDEMEGIIDSISSGGDFNTIKLKLHVEYVQFLMNKVREYIVRIENEENKLLEDRQKESAEAGSRTLAIILTGSFLVFCLLLLVFSFIRKTFKHQKLIEERIRDANIELRHITGENEKKNWILTGSSEVDAAIRGELDITKLSGNVITVLAKYVDARVGALYLSGETGILTLSGSYALRGMEGKARQFEPGEGLIGQVALEKKAVIFSDVPQDYIRIESGTGDTAPRSLLIQPILFEDEIKGVLELGFTFDISELKIAFIREVVGAIGIAINTAQARVRLRNLVNQTRQQAEELESQHEELRAANEELLQKTHQLQASEEELTVQQEELRQMNAELEEKAEMLEERNRIIEKTKEAIDLKAQELEQTGRYKSEFLANMSHELRTPLNSILILAKILKENKSENLTADQIKYAGVIHNAGSDLLTLINDILDLSKIESGKLDLTIEEVRLDELRDDMISLFAEVANSKGITFSYQISPGVSDSIISDKLRIEQVLKNLLSNAFKFTPEKGSVTVSVSKAGPETVYTNKALYAASEVISFQVKDTGIGISADQQKVIFEAFKQADGSTSRKYGGTGLGLSICRELVHLLQGEIKVESQFKQGSTFTLFLPIEGGSAEATPREQDEHKYPDLNVNPETLTKSDSEASKLSSSENIHTLLIIEDDEIFANQLREYALERNFRPLIASRGDVGLKMAQEQQPDAIVLDIKLPVMDGWTVLKRLKEDMRTKDIPVHLMSSGDAAKSKVRKEGAVGFLQKPVDKEQLDEIFDSLIDGREESVLRKVLVVEDQKVVSEVLARELSARNIAVVQAFDGKQALNILEKDMQFDCIILDLRLPDISGVELLKKIKEDARLNRIPVVINTAMELDKETMHTVMKYTNAMVLKGGKSNHRLLDEVNLFMNKIKTVVPRSGSSLADKPLKKNNSTMEKALKGKYVLVVDDDMRNIFALSSALQDFELKIEIANNGKEALQQLEEHPDIDIVLMDLMMPEMDGYEAIREIRKQYQYRDLPVIALTAKAMKNDREKCMEAGANDYISKPLDINKLLSMMRVWLS